MTQPAKYDRVHDHVLDLIEQLGRGARMPPERQLANDLDVSRMTLRRVLDDLVREGYLERRQGSGTFIGAPKISQPLSMTSFSEDMRRRGFVPASRTLELRGESAGPRLGRRLEVAPDARVCRITRLRLADGVPMAIETLHVPEEVAPDISPDALDALGFYALLHDRFGVDIAVGHQTIEPTVVTDEEAALLEVPTHSPAFLFERVSRDARRQPVEYVRSVYRGDRYRIETELLPSRTLLAAAHADGDGSTVAAPGQAPGAG